MTLKVIRAGFSSVQDLGRFGHEAVGVAPGGAADPLAAQLANALVGNAADAALLEIQLSAATFVLERDACIALTGARVDLSTAGRPRANGQPIWLRSGDEIKVGPFKQGRAAYLGIAGGIAVPALLGSRSTDLQAGFGGFGGRWLRALDVLTLGDPPSKARHQPNWWCELELPGDHAILRYLPGPISAPGLANSIWTVGRDATRMAINLQGSPLAFDCAEQPSGAVFPGVIQLPPAGLPIILSVDAQTLGGYPLVGCVVHADLRRLAQLLPGARVKLEPIDAGLAITLAKRQQAEFNATLYAIRDRL